jgi:hypothetical protein
LPNKATEAIAEDRSTSGSETIQALLDDAKLLPATVHRTGPPATHNRHSCLGIASSFYSRMALPRLKRIVEQNCRGPNRQTQG